MTKARRYWVNTVSRDHVRAAVEGGFTQADHGKVTRLKRLNKGDLMAFYSPKTHFKDGERLQAFTALGEITDTEPYRVEMTEDFHPWRRKMTFKQSDEAPIQPLIEHLGFIKDKQKWGFPFQRGLFKIDKADFELIAKATNVRIEAS